MRTFPTVNSRVTAAAHIALDLIQTRYGQDASTNDRMAFHGLQHTVGVMARAEALAKAMGGSAHEVALACIAAAFHDTVQQWEEAPGQDGRIMRRRFAGKNEDASAQEAVTWMQSQGGMFTGADEALVREAILATVPAWDVATGTVKQPELKPESSIVVRAVALADLATAGMDPEDFVPEGDSLFREENLDVAAAIASGDIPQDQQDAYKARMMAWRATQPGFARGRAVRLEEELGNLCGEAKQRVRALFVGFDDAIAAAEKALCDRQNLSFYDVAKATGYSIPSV